MTITIGITFVLSLILAALFWIYLIKGIYHLITKKDFGKKNKRNCIVFAITSIIFGGFSATILISSISNGSLTSSISHIAAVNYESARRGWSKGLLKKLKDIKFKIYSIEEANEDLIWYNESENKNIKTYEITLLVNLPENANPQISYKELKKANLVYCIDENDVYIPGYIINHSELDDIPWLFKWLFPSYRREQAAMYLPLGNSYLNIRVDLRAGSSIKKVVIGETKVDFPQEMIQKNKSEENDLQKEKAVIEENKI